MRFARLALLGMCNGVNRWFSKEGPASVEVVADGFADLALAMVQATRDGHPVRLADMSLPSTEDVVAIVADVYAGIIEE